MMPAAAAMSCSARSVDEASVSGLDLGSLFVFSAERGDSRGRALVTNQVEGMGAYRGTSRGYSGDCLDCSLSVQLHLTKLTDVIFF